MVQLGYETKMRAILKSNQEVINMRLKKRHLLFSLLLFALLIVACRGKNSEQPVESDDAPERSSSDISAGDAPEPSSSDIAGDDDMPHIVWARNVFERALTKDMQNRIQ